MKYENKNTAFFLLSILFGMASTLNAQTTIERSVFSNAGAASSNGSVILSYTIGESLSLTHDNNSYLLRQGFEQPIQDTIISTFLINDELAEVTLFPNPTSDFIHLEIKSEQASQFNYQILSMDGKQVQFGTLVDDKTIINLDFLSAAQYVLMLSTADLKQQQEFKIIKTN